MFVFCRLLRCLLELRSEGVRRMVFERGWEGSEYLHQRAREGSLDFVMRKTERMAMRKRRAPIVA